MPIQGQVRIDLGSIRDQLWGDSGSIQGRFRVDVGSIMGRFVVDAGSTPDRSGIDPFSDYPVELQDSLNNSFEPFPQPWLQAIPVEQQLLAIPPTTAWGHSLQTTASGHSLDHSLKQFLRALKPELSELKRACGRTCRNCASVPIALV